MNAGRDTVVDALHALATRFPATAFDDADFTEAALRDAFDNAFPRERALLVAAVRQIPPSAILTAPAPDALALARIDASSADARWAVDAWRSAYDAPVTQTLHDAPQPKPDPTPTPTPWLPRAAVGVLVLAAVLVFGPRIAGTIFPAPVARPSASPSDLAVAPSASPDAIATIRPFSLPFSGPLVTPRATSVPPAIATTMRAKCIDEWSAGHWTTARGACATAVSLLPADPLVQLGLGEALVATNQNEQARQPLIEASRLETAVIESAGSEKRQGVARIAYQNRGYAHYELAIIDRSADEYRQAKDDFNESRSLGLLDSDALYFSADASYQLHAWCDAEHAYRLALTDPQLNPAYVKNAKRRAAEAGASCRI